VPVDIDRRAEFGAFDFEAGSTQTRFGDRNDALRDNLRAFRGGMRADADDKKETFSVDHHLGDVDDGLHFFLNALFGRLRNGRPREKPSAEERKEQRHGDATHQSDP
jgi:hypothetical protein